MTTHKDKPHDREHHIAIRDAEQAHASDEYFNARHFSLDTIDRRKVFEAGFMRGFDAHAERASPVTPAAQPDNYHGTTLVSSEESTTVQRLRARVAELEAAQAVAEIFPGTSEALNKLSVFHSEDQP